MPKIGTLLQRSRSFQSLLLAQAALAAGALVVNILAARGLGPQARGELALYLQLGYSINVLCLLGRHRAYLRARVPDMSVGQSVREMAGLLRVPTALSMAAALGVAAFAFDGWVPFLLLTAALAIKMISGLFVNGGRASAIVSNSTTMYLAAVVTGQVLLVTTSVVFVVADVSSAVWWLLAYGVTAALPFILLEWRVRARDDRPPRASAELRPVRALGFKLVPASLAEAVITRADRLLIPVFSTFSQLGLYAVVSTMTELAAWPAKQYADARTPVWVRQLAAGETGGLFREMGRLMAVTSVIALAVVATLTVAIVPIFGEAYEDSRQLVLPLGLAAIAYAFNATSTALAVAAGSARAATLINGSAMTCALPAYAYFIEAHGALGAAWVSVAAYAVASAVAMAWLSAAVGRKGARRGTAND